MLTLTRERNTKDNTDQNSNYENSFISGGAVVSLDALRQLGQLLGLSSQHSDEKRVSPYTGTEDTLTLATPISPQLATPAPTPTAPPTPSPTPPPLPAQDNVNQQNSLTRISERKLVDFLYVK